MAKPKKDRKLFHNLIRITEQYMRGRGFYPMTRQELMEKLGLPDHHLNTFKEVLDALVKQGVALKKGYRYLTKRTHNDVVSGEVRVHSRGFGFVVPDNRAEYPQDIFIPRHLTLHAVDGDRVEAEVNNAVASEKGPEGKIIAILERGRTHIAGIVRECSPDGRYTAYAPLLGDAQSIHVTSEESLQPGDRVIMEVIDWGSRQEDTYCRFSHRIGHINDPSCDIAAAVEEYELRENFPIQALEQAEVWGKSISRKEIGNRKDLRERRTITIDPETAKDFDDALDLIKNESGRYHLGVHIADVSHYVERNSPLDLEAYSRSNSTYFPGKCIPMLPPALSENLCSLKPKVNRLAVTVMMEFDEEGTLVNHSFHKSVIRSKKRFTYSEAKLVMDGKKKSPYRDDLMLMAELCALLKKKRYERGSIEFSIPEFRIVVDANGDPLRTEFHPYDITHQLVEEFMLKANEVVATKLSEKGTHLPYRVHEEPTSENLKDFSSLVAAFGFKLSEQPTPHELQELFDEVLETPYGEYLATNYIRRMKQANYSPKNVGHYGLGLGYYCHFTSPIRRYVDLVIHRILFGEAYEFDLLENISKECSEQERISEKAENNVRLLKKLRLLKKRFEEDPRRQYEAIVTRVRNFGVVFEVLDFMIEGFLHVSDLSDDYFVFQEKSQKLVGTRTKASFFAGDRMTVMIKGVDLIYSESQWRFVSEKKHKKQKRSRR